MENIKKREFWNELNRRYQSVSIFCDWIEQYQKAESYTWRVICGNLKFHELPLEYQSLILRKFIQETGLPDAQRYSRSLSPSPQLETFKINVTTFFSKLDENIKY